MDIIAGLTVPMTSTTPSLQAMPVVGSRLYLNSPPLIVSLIDYAHISCNKHLKTRRSRISKLRHLVMEIPSTTFILHFPQVLRMSLVDIPPSPALITPQLAIVQASECHRPLQLSRTQMDTLKWIAILPGSYANTRWIRISSFKLRTRFMKKISTSKQSIHWKSTSLKVGQRHWELWIKFVEILKYFKMKIFIRLFR